MTIKEMREKKQEMGYTYEQIAELAQLPVGTVQKVLGGITKSPRYETLQALESVFMLTSATMIQESAAPYFVNKKQGEYTVEDYRLLPDATRVELIDGVFYDMAAPVNDHQLIAGKIYSIFMNYISAKGGRCIPGIAPMDVMLDCDNRTIVQPDIMVICDRSKFKRGGIWGAPDLVIEVLSPSTAKIDKYKKLAKYQTAGVREYWMVDLKKRIVVVHDFIKDDGVIYMYSFDDVVPVNIFDGDCKIDFKDIWEYIKFLYEIEEEDSVY